MWLVISNHEKKRLRDELNIAENLTIFRNIFLYYFQNMVLIN